ncbi:hypothetical protein EVAR_239_1 [Eumeta japonica]|uniref:Uncharacterized protein n=1 Tax=Eumeta variegata TaxID=151549 RepID=A0A4C1S9A7_EUMVA|nr:hypothetical protein EVAR_239_1 [Eumeta japonica]
MYRDAKSVQSQRSSWLDIRVADDSEAVLQGLSNQSNICPPIYIADIVIYKSMTSDIAAALESAQTLKSSDHEIHMIPRYDPKKVRNLSRSAHL